MCEVCGVRCACVSHSAPCLSAILLLESSARRNAVHTVATAGSSTTKASECVASGAIGAPGWSETSAAVERLARAPRRLAQALEAVAECPVGRLGAQ